MAGRVSQKRDERRRENAATAPRRARPRQFIAPLFAREKEIRVDYGYYAIRTGAGKMYSAETSGGANRRQLMSHGGFF